MRSEFFRKIALTLLGVSFLFLTESLVSGCHAINKQHLDPHNPTRTVARTPSGTTHDHLGWARKLIILTGSAAIGVSLLVWLRRYGDNTSPASVPIESATPRKQYAYSPVVREADKSPAPWAEQLTGSMVQPLFHRGVGKVKVDALKPVSPSDEVTQAIEPKSFIPPAGIPPKEASAPHVPTSPLSTKSILPDEAEPDAWAAEAALPKSHVSELFLETPVAAQERAVRGHDSAGFLPVDLYAHFSLHAGEKIVLTKPFSIPFFEEGVLGLTNQRLVAVVMRRTINFNPPGIMTEQRRHKASLTQITRYKEMSNPRVELLAPALVLIWFWWIGTTLAIMCGIAAFVWPRHHLAIEIRNSHRRSYPLPLSEVREVLQRLGSLRADAMAELKKCQQFAKDQDRKKPV